MLEIVLLSDTLSEIVFFFFFLFLKLYILFFIGIKFAQLHERERNFLIKFYILFL